MTKSPRLFLAMMICLLVFMGAWYDTVHMHALTASLNYSIHSLFAVALPPTGTGPTLYYHVLNGITFFGGNLAFIIIIGVILLDLLRKKEYKVALFCVIGVVGIFGLTELCKHLIYSPRPIPFATEHNSFPSGHTMRATLWCGLILLLSHRKLISLPPLVLRLVMLIPLLVGFSRLGLSKHWITDLLGAYSLTIGLLLLTYFLINKMCIKQG